MGKRKKILLIIGIVLIVAILAAAALFVMKWLGGDVAGSKSTPDKTLTAVFDALGGEETEAPLLIGADGSPVRISGGSGIAALISRELDFEVLEMETDGDEAVASVKIQSPDTIALVQQALEGMEEYDEAQFLQKMQTLLEGKHAKREVTVEVELVKQDAAWYVVSSADFSDAITGGMISRYAELQQSIMDAMTGGAAE